MRRTWPRWTRSISTTYSRRPTSGDAGHAVINSCARKCKSCSLVCLADGCSSICLSKPPLEESDKQDFTLHVQGKHLPAEVREAKCFVMHCLCLHPRQILGAVTSIHPGKYGLRGWRSTRESHSSGSSSSWMLQLLLHCFLLLSGEGRERNRRLAFSKCLSIPLSGLICIRSMSFSISRKRSHSAVEIHLYLVNAFM